MTPSVLCGTNGACVKYDAALATKRILWVSACFRESNPGIWLLILEAMSCHANKWKLLDAPEAYAGAKVNAIKGNRSAEVLALVTADEAVANPLPHVFVAHTFLDFIKKRDVDRTSLGLTDL